MTGNFTKRRESAETFVMPTIQTKQARLEDKKTFRDIRAATQHEQELNNIVDLAARPMTLLFNVRPGSHEPIRIPESNS